MKNTTKEVFDAFRSSMLAKTEDWKNLLAEEVKLTGPLAQVEGKAAFIEVNTPFFASIQDSQLLELAESGDYMITQITTTVAVPSRESLTLNVSEWYRISDGLIQSLVVYFDTADFRKALGM